jgi:UDP-N-acetylmuramate-alanine ligase
VHLVRQVAELPAALTGLTRAGDLVLLLGAGSIGGVGTDVMTALDTSAGGGA